MKIAVIPNLTKPDAFLLTERAVKTLLSLHAEALLSELKTDGEHAENGDKECADKTVLT